MTSAPDIPAIPTPALRQLVYTSTAAEAAIDLDRLLAVARAKNRARGITGLLLHAGDRFMQYLEGPPGAVGELFVTIASDRRHHTVNVLADGPVGKRGFPDWSMATAEIDTLAWLRLTLAAWPKAENGAATVAVEAPSGLKMLEEFRPGPGSEGGPEAAPGGAG